MSTSTAARAELDAAHKALARAGWVSFDVFETLLRRSVLSPVHVFGLLHDEMATAAGFAAVDRDEFVRLRTRSERLARRRKRLAASSTEVTLAEIWREVARERPDIDPEEGSRAEVAAETRVLTQRESGVELYRRARERELSVVCVSDMYHSSSTIATWLASVGIVPDAVFVSCEHGIGKREGLLAEVARRLSVSPRRGLHIGDSEVVDGRGARASGLSARIIAHGSVTLMPPGRAPRGLGATESQLLQRAAHQWSDHSTGDLAVDLGHSVLGPAVAGYAAFAAGRERACGADVALYTSRDTKLVHEVASDHPSDTGSRREYAHLSRQSLYVPSLAGGITDADRGLLVGGAWPMAAGLFLDRVGLDCEQNRAVLERHGVSPETIIASKADKQTMAGVFVDLEPQLRAVAAERLEELGRYLETLGVLSARTVLLVELGWRGTIRNSLARCLTALGWKGALDASYVALLWRPWPTHEGASTWLTGHPRNHAFHRALAGAVPVVEAMFQADEASVERYAGARPVLAGGAGTREVLDPVQRGARRYLSANRAAVSALVGDGAPDPALALPLMRLLEFPSGEEARLLGRCRYADGFGAGAPTRTILPLGRGNDGGATQWHPGRTAAGL